MRPESLTHHKETKTFKVGENDIDVEVDYTNKTWEIYVWSNGGSLDRIDISSFSSEEYKLYKALMPELIKAMECAETMLLGGGD